MASFSGEQQVDEAEIIEVIQLAEKQGNQRADIRAAASEIFLSMSDDEQSRRCLFANNVTPLLLRWSADANEEVAERCLGTLVNLVADLFEERVEEMLRRKVVDRVFELVTAGECSAKKRDLALSLLANVTTTIEGARQALQLDNPEPLLHGQRMRGLVDRFVATEAPAGAAGTDSVDGWQHVASVVCNLSQLQEGRDLLRRRSTQLVARLLPQLASPNPVRRRGVAAAVRNCCFEVSDHPWLLQELGAVGHLLLPLAGPEELAPEEREGMDPWLLARLGPDKEREPDLEVRRSLLGALQLLCTDKASRQFLRKRRAYPIIRNYDTSESDEANSEVAFNIVNFLVRDEEQGDNEDLLAASSPDGAASADAPVRPRGGFKPANAHHARPAADVDVDASEKQSEFSEVD